MNKMTCAVEHITPELAAEYLTHNIANNRGYKPKVGRRYADDMVNGKWQENGEPIIFNENGDLIDGQHRLNAIIQSKVAIDVVVVRNVAADITTIDVGCGRRLEDIYRMRNMSYSCSNKQSVATAKLFLRMTGKADSSSLEHVYDFLISNSELIERSYNLTGNHKGGTLNVHNAVLQTALYCALQSGENEDKLNRFVEVFRTGFMQGDKERAAIVCRNDVLAKDIMVGGATMERIKAVNQITKAIYDFCHGVARKKSYKNFDENVYISFSKK